MILCGRATVWWLLWLAGATAAAAQEAPGDTLPGTGPVEPQAVATDTLVSGGWKVTVPEVGPPACGRSILGNERLANRRFLMELASGSLGEAIFAVPGVHVAKSGWHGLPQVLSLRGTRPDDVVYLLDGIPFSDNQLEAFDLSWVPLAGIESCEIAKGGLSSVHGSGATAGALGFRTVTAMPEFPESEIGAWWGGYETRAVSLRFNRRITTRLGILGTYENLETGGWTDDSSADNDRFFGKATAVLGKTTRLDLMGYTYRGGFERPDSCPGDPSTNPADIKNERSLLGVSIVTGERRRFHVSCFRLGTSESYSPPAPRFREKGLLQGAEVGVAWLSPDSARTDFWLGFRNRRFESDSLGNRTSTDLYAHALREIITGRSKLQGSVRLAKNSGFHLEGGGGLAVRYALREGLFLFSRFDRSYRFPGFHVLYNRGEDHPADSGITTETWWGLEVGALVSRGPLSASVSLFGRDASGLALWLMDDSCRAYLDPGVDMTLMGLETSLSFSMRPWFETELSYSAVRVCDGEAVRPAYVPPYAITATARGRKTLSRHISAGITFAGRYQSPTGMGFRLDPCTSGAACLGSAELTGHLSALLTAYIDIDRVTVLFRVQNLLNDSISTAWGRPELPSRSYEFGTSWRLLD